MFTELLWLITQSLCTSSKIILNHWEAFRLIVITWNEAFQCFLMSMICVQSQAICYRMEVARLSLGFNNDIASYNIFVALLYQDHLVVFTSETFWRSFCPVLYGWGNLNKAYRFSLYLIWRLLMHWLRIFKAFECALKKCCEDTFLMRNLSRNK